LMNHDEKVSSRNSQLIIELATLNKKPHIL